MSKNNKSYKIILLSSLAAVATIIALAEIQLPLPESEKGTHELLANIDSCKIDLLGRSADDKYYIHMYFKTPDLKKISHNFNGVEKPFYIRICNDKSMVRVKYYAVRSPRTHRSMQKPLLKPW